MKKLLLSCMVLSIAFYACKKHDKNDSTTPVVKPISPDSAQIMSDSMQLINKTAATTGTLPVAGSANIVLSETDTVIAINGGYAVIVPQFNGGQPYGYYVQVVGANNYFTMDVPVNDPLRVKQGKGSRFINTINANRSYADSVIAFKLPSNLAAGTFKVKYEAYDANHVVSNAVTTVVKVLTNDVTSSDFKALAGNWNAVGDYTVSGQDTTIYPLVRDDSTYYTCVSNQLQENEEGEDYLLRARTINNYQLILTADSRHSTRLYETYIDINLNTSTCGKPVYDSTSEDYLRAAGGIYLNTTTKDIVITSDNNGAAGAVYIQNMWHLVSLTANKMVVSFPNEDGQEFIVFEK